MAVQVAWSGIYLQLSSFNFLMSGLFGDILCLRFFLTFAYLFLFINAILGFPPLGELYVARPTEIFILHWDVLLWSSVTLYVHFSKFMGILLNEKQIHLPRESIPLWRLLYRNGGLSQLLFKQYIYPKKFSLVHFKAGTPIPTDNDLYIILDGVAEAHISLLKGGDFRDLSHTIKTNTTTSNDKSTPSKTVITSNKTSSPSSSNSPSGIPGSSTPYSKKKLAMKKTTSADSGVSVSHRKIVLISGEMINIKVLNLFRAGSESEAFANQTVHATAITDMTCYKCTDVDLRIMAQTPQTKNAYQGLLIFALTGIAEREIMFRHFSDSGEYSDYTTHRDAGPDGRDLIFQPLQEWEEPNPLISGSGKALSMPIRHFASSMKSSFRPPWPIIRWIPGLRHAALPAPDLCPPEKPADTISSLTNVDFDESEGKQNYGSTEKVPLINPTGMDVEGGKVKHHGTPLLDNRSGGPNNNNNGGGGGRGGFWFFGRK